MATSTVSQQDLSAWIDQFKATLSKGRVRQLPSPERAAEVLRDMVATAPHPLADRIGPVWSSIQTREQLGLNSRQALDSRRRSGSILGVRASNGAIYYPVSQFRVVNGAVEVRPALAAMFKALRDQDPWAVATLLTVPAPELEDQSPLQWEYADKDSSALAMLAHRVRREWADA